MKVDGGKNNYSRHQMRQKEINALYLHFNRIHAAHQPSHKYNHNDALNQAVMPQMPIKLIIAQFVITINTSVIVIHGGDDNGPTDLSYI